MDAVKRYQVADYLNTAKSGTESFALMGVGFNTLDESPNAQKDSKTYINQKAQTSTIKSYQPTFAFDSDLIADEAAVMALYEIGRNQLTGADAERDYVRVELWRKHRIPLKQENLRLRLRFPLSPARAAV